ncbi:MAG: pentapeptide repeat-containing protein [Verrucomicrobia bacterium]|nr:pentapeptide repeat-containing protein [Verrucomicrobiota bacterium]
MAIVGGTGLTAGQVQGQAPDLYGKLEAGDELSFAADASEESRMISADRIAEVVRKKVKIRLANAIIYDPLILTSVTFENEVSFNHCEFKAAVDFAHIVAKQRIDFSDWVFEKGVVFA